jgi:hypothetical protein
MIDFILGFVFNLSALIVVVVTLVMVVVVTEKYLHPILTTLLFLFTAYSLFRGLVYLTSLVNL